MAFTQFVKIKICSSGKIIILCLKKKTNTFVYAYGFKLYERFSFFFLKKKECSYDVLMML